MNNLEREKIITTDILELVDIKFMQNLQDFFAKTMNVSLVNIYNGKLLTNPSKPIEFCNKHTKRNKSSWVQCEECHKLLEKKALTESKPIITKCDLGFTLFIIPIIINDNYLGGLLGGPFLTEPPTKLFFKETAKKLKIKETDCIKEIKKLPILSMEKVQAVTDLLHLVTNTTASIAYINRKLKPLGIEYKMPQNIALEEWFSNPYGDVQNLITGREFEVLKLVAQGKNNAEIAKELCISVHTAKAHVSSIIEKFKVEDRVQVAVKAVRGGII